MKVLTEMLKVPVGYSKNIEDFVFDVIPLAFQRGETKKDFDTDFFYQLLDKKIKEEEEKIIIAYARRAMGEGLDSVNNFKLSYEEYLEQFELGAKIMMEHIIIDNRLTTRALLKQDVCSMTIQKVAKDQWMLKINLY